MHLPHVIPLTWSHGEADVNKMETGLAHQLTAVTCCSEKQNKSTRLDDCREPFLCFILPQDREVRFYVSVNSPMLTYISLEGYNVRSCSAASSAGPGWLSHLVIVAQLGKYRRNHQAFCEQFERLETGSVTPSHYQIICA